MLLDRTHSRWALLSGLTLTIGATAWFICHAASPNGLSGGSVPGLLFGIIGTLMMFFAGLLGARRPLRHRRIGSASFWLKGHLWLGTLCIPFILFHASFSLGGLLEQVLWFCLAFVAASGFFGLAVQQFLPRLLWKNVPLESFEPQSPWLCDRMTLTADIRISTACDRRLPEISEHLRQSARRLVQAFDQIVAGSESRSEKNARKLLMMQQLTPFEHRDYFWSMAKLAKSDLKAIPFEGDFADLLAKIYENLRELPPVTAAATSTNAGTKAEPGPVVTSHPRTTTPPQPSASAPTQHKATDKALVAATSNTAQTPAEPAAETTQPAAPAAPQTKLSPLELMKQKAAEKAAAAAAAANSTAQTPAEPTAATTQPAATAAPPTKLSPLELMKQKAAEKAASATAANNPAQAAGEPAPPSTTASTPKPAVVKEPPQPPVKPPLPPRSTPTPAPGPASAPPTPRPASAAPSPEDRQLLWQFYTQLVRPFIANSRSAASVRQSPLANEIDAGRRFREIQMSLPATLHDLLRELQESCNTRRQIEQQRTLLRWMHWWLALHIPVSLLLIVFTLAHIVMALRVVPFRF